MLILIINSFIV
ncbi:hypothetical protein VCHC41B1_0942A, partial [Vibrio cholerae HC-41B1]